MSLSRISKLHGVARSTLHKLVKKGKPFSGSGSKVKKYLSKDEEEMLAEKSKSLVLAGFELTWANLQELIKQELDSLLMKDSERIAAPLNWPNLAFTRRFATRYNIINLVSKKNYSAINVYPY